MSTRMIRTLAIAAGAGALVLSAAGPVMAATNYPVTTFPAKVSAVPTDTIALSFVGPADSDICNTALWTWSVRVVGQRSGIVTPLPAVACATNTASVTLTVATPTTKKQKANSVVKLVAAPIGGNTAEAVVLTTVVKVNHKTGKPANTGKPTS